MGLLKAIWPIPFKVKKLNIISLVFRLVLFLVVTAIIGVLMGILAGFPVIGTVFSVIGSLMGIYNIVGIVLCILKFLGTIK